MTAGSDFCCFACRTTGRLARSMAGSGGLHVTGVRPRIRRVSGMTQSGSATQRGGTLENSGEMHMLGWELKELRLRVR